MIHNFNKLNDDIYRGGAPLPNDIAKLKKNNNINKVISLDENDGKRIKNICNDLNIKHIILPLTMEKSSIINLLSQDMDELFFDDSPIFIHCHAGKDRTGLVCALIRCKYFDWPCDKALKEAFSFGFGVNFDPELRELYIEIICNFCNKKHDHFDLSLNKIEDDYNEARDIVSNERNELENSLHDGSSGMQSFAPFSGDPQKTYPYNDPYQYYSNNSDNELNQSDLSKLYSTHMNELEGIAEPAPWITNVK